MIAHPKSRPTPSGQLCHWVGAANNDGNVFTVTP